MSRALRVTELDEAVRRAIQGKGASNASDFPERLSLCDILPASLIVIYQEKRAKYGLKKFFVPKFKVKKEKFPNRINFVLRCSIF